LKKPEPDLTRLFREIERRAEAEGVEPREYLDRLLRSLEERRRNDVLERRRSRTPPQ
jgi:hypothetical protein